MKTTNKLILISAMAILGSASAQAATIGTNVGGGIWSGDKTAGGVGVNYAYVAGDQSTSPDPSLGNRYNYRAEATYNVGELTPELRASIFTTDITQYSDPYISADAYGFQTYQNTSNTSQTYTLNLSLHAIIDNGFGYDGSYLDAEVGIFTGTDMFSSSSACSGTTSNRLSGFGLYMCGPKLGTGFTRYIEMVGDGEQTILDDVSFSIAAGETFTIYGELQTLSSNGSINALNTLSMNFDDISNLRALGVMPSPVPVPAAVWLFGSGLVGLIGVARRKTRS